MSRFGVETLLLLAMTVPATAAISDGAGVNDAEVDILSVSTLDEVVVTGRLDSLSGLQKANPPIIAATAAPTVRRWYGVLFIESPLDSSNGNSKKSVLVVRIALELTAMTQLLAPVTQAISAFSPYRSDVIRLRKSQRTCRKVGQSNLLREQFLPLWKT